jgi:3-oxoadipate enol-lactonase
MPEITTADATLFYEIDGAGDPVTVIAHGLTNNRNELAAFTSLVPGSKVRFDFRGHGRSSSPSTGYRFADFARDVDAVASAFDATIAVGTSLGAGAIGNLVCRIPDRFERMIWLLPAGLDVPFSQSPRYDALAEAIDGKSPEEALEAVLGDPARVAEAIQTPWRFELERVMWDHADPSGLARAIHGIVDDFPIPDRELLRRVEIPTLIVCIEGDDIHPADLGRIFVDLMPKAELIVFSGLDDLYAGIPSLLERVIAFMNGDR